MVTVSDPAEPVKVNVHETLQVVVNVVATQPPTRPAGLCETEADLQATASAADLSET